MLVYNRFADKFIIHFVIGLNFIVVFYSVYYIFFEELKQIRLLKM